MRSNPMPLGMSDLITPGFLRRSAEGEPGDRMHDALSECRRHGSYFDKACSLPEFDTFQLHIILFNNNNKLSAL